MGFSWAGRAPSSLRAGSLCAGGARALFRARGNASYHASFGAWLGGSLHTLIKACFSIAPQGHQ